jgi:hypothetical protein
MGGDAEKDDEPNSSVAVKPSEPGPLLKTKSRSGMIVTVQTEGDSGETNEKDSDSDQPIEWSLNDFDATNRSWSREILDSINTIRFNVGVLVNNSRVQVLIVVLIVVNAIMMGIATYDIVKKNPEVDRIFETVDEIFLIIFTVELCLQFIYLGWRLPFDGWLLFDLIIIITSWSFQSVQIIRAFRIFRALRLVTRIKIMKNLLLGKLVSLGME